MTHEDKRREMGITLPELPRPLGSYVPFVRTGNLIFITGMLPLVNGQLTAAGRVGETVMLHEAAQAARTAAVNALAVLKSAVGSLDEVKRCFGDCVRIEMFDDNGDSIFGAIDQRVVKAA